MAGALRCVGDVYLTEFFDSVLGLAQPPSASKQSATIAALVGLSLIFTGRKTSRITTSHHGLVVAAPCHPCTKFPSGWSVQLRVILQEPRDRPRLRSTLLHRLGRPMCCARSSIALSSDRRPAPSPIGMLRLFWRIGHWSTRHRDPLLDVLQHGAADRRILLDAERFGYAREHDVKTSH